MIGLLFTGLVVVVSTLISIVTLAFTCWMLVECVTREPSLGTERLIWVLIILFVPFVGPLLYYVVRRTERIRTYGR